jgi:hypothetical protein
MMSAITCFFCLLAAASCCHSHRDAVGHFGDFSVKNDAFEETPMASAAC